MAFEEPFCLRKGDATAQVVGIAAAGRHSILVSYHKRIDLQDLFNRRCVESWSIGASGRLTSPCVFCEQTDTFYAVKDEETVMFWKRGQPSSSFTEETLASSVHGILPVSGEPDPTVVFNDGSVCMLRNARRRRKKAQRRKREIEKSVFWCDVSSASRLFVVQKSSSGYSVSVSSLNKDCWKTDICLPVLEPENAGDLMVCCVLDAGDNSTQLISLYDNGSIWNQSVAESESRETTKVIEWKDWIGNKGLSSVAVCPVSSSYVSVAIANAVDCELSATVHLLDVKNGTLCQKRQLPLENSCNETDLPLNMSFVPGYLSTVISSEVHVLPFSWQESTLDTVRKHHQATLASKPPTAFSSLKKFLSPDKEIESKKEAERHWAKTLVTCPDAAQFNALYRNGAHTLNNDKLPEPMGKTRSRKNCVKVNEKVVVPTAEPTDPAVMQYILTETALRLKEDKTFWPRSSLLEIIAASNGSPSSYTHVLNAAICCKDEDVLKAVLQKDVDLEESAIVQCLKHALQLGVGDNDDEMLSLILKKPFTDYTMQSALKDLPFDAALKLLARFLDDLKPEENLTFPKEFEISKWIGLILDAHFSQLMLDQKARELIFQLHSTVTEKVYVFEQVRKIEGIVDYMTTPLQIQKHSAKHKYIVETMDF